VLPELKESFKRQKVLGGGHYEVDIQVAVGGSAASVNRAA